MQKSDKDSLSHLIEHLANHIIVWNHKNNVYNGERMGIVEDHQREIVAEIKESWSLYLSHQYHKSLAIEQKNW